MKNEKINIDNLVNLNPDMVTAPALKLALEMHRKEQNEREAAVALERLRQIEIDVQGGVNMLRKLRRQEREVKERLEKIVAAKEQFLRDGDWTAYLKARSIA